MSVKTLEGIYTDILATAWMFPDELNEIVQKVSEETGEVKKVIIEDKVLALPTRDNLSRSGRDNLMIFHPLAEGLMGGTSPILDKMRRILSIRCSLVGSSMFQTLLSGATNSAEFTKFSPDQTELLKCIKDIDERSLKDWNKLVDLAIDKYKERSYFTDINLRQNSAIEGNTFSRVAYVRFPIYEELKKNDTKLFGSSYAFRKNDRATFMRMFEFMYPGIEHQDSYSVGSNKRIAPFLDCMLGAFGNLFKITNNLYDKFNTAIPMESFLKVELEWLDELKDIEVLATLARSIPQQYGNFAIKVEEKIRSETGTTGTALAKQPENYSRQVTVNDTRSAPPIEKEEKKEERIVKLGHVGGIGRPLAQANGVVMKQELDMRANVITDSQQFHQNQDPIQTMRREINEIRAAGGVGVINMSSANNNQQNFNQQNNQLFQNQNNNGWNTGGQQFQQQQQQSPFLNREIALRQMLGGNNGMGTGSVI